jgi:hypothetical protein
VYEKFPIPLINRLEKHYLGTETMLTDGRNAPISYCTLFSLRVYFFLLNYVASASVCYFLRARPRTVFFVELHVKINDSLNF